MNKTELRSATSAANKIIRLMIPEERKDYTGCFYDKQGRQIIISNYIALRLNEHLSVAEAKIPFGEVDGIFLSACKNTEKLDLLSLEYLTDYIQNAKDDEPERYKGRNHEPIAYDFGERSPMVNAEYLLLIYKALGWRNLIAKANEDKWETSPIYFSLDRGDGILMPMRKKACIKWTR